MLRTLRTLTRRRVLEDGYRVAFSARYLRMLDRRNYYTVPIWAKDNERRHYQLYKATWRIAMLPTFN